MELGFSDIQQLTKLFNPPKDNSDSEDDNQECGDEGDSTDIIGPNGDNAEAKPKKVNPYNKLENTNEYKEYLSEEGFYEEQGKKSESDWKKTPVWDIAYKQQVTASDVFLQIGLKGPATASCEDMIVTVKLPGDSHYNMDLKIHKNNMVLVTPKHYLDLQLPHPVDPQLGNAKWDNETESLAITLRMDREFDLVNF
ncbi:unnamed protein product [Phyllotreta striolata]|uniref:PIH1D1/2/3 CS-like domain-containing protein n=1 Tax=Phyllotreta striolata TaxID=444603 RepID=A0A9N9TIC3_PHYSR|nr:unnamed protein product [Phyllotreta striolata]